MDPVSAIVAADDYIESVYAALKATVQAALDRGQELLRSIDAALVGPVQGSADAIGTALASIDGALLLPVATRLAVAGQAIDQLTQDLPPSPCPTIEQTVASLPPPSGPPSVGTTPPGGILPPSPPPPPPPPPAPPAGAVCPPDALPAPDIDDPVMVPVECERQVVVPAGPIASDQANEIAWIISAAATEWSDSIRSFWGYQYDRWGKAVTVYDMIGEVFREAFGG